MALYHCGTLPNLQYGLVTGITNSDWTTVNFEFIPKHLYIVVPTTSSTNSVVVAHYDYNTETLKGLYYNNPSSESTINWITNGNLVVYSSQPYVMFKSPWSVSGGNGNNWLAFVIVG